MLDEFGLSSALSLYLEGLKKRSGLSIELPAFRFGHERIKGIFIEFSKFFLAEICKGSRIRIVRLSKVLRDRLACSKQRPYYDLAMFLIPGKVPPEWSVHAVKCP
jgi:hypothetical protein